MRQDGVLDLLAGDVVVQDEVFVGDDGSCCVSRTSARLGEGRSDVDVVQLAQSRP